MINFLVSEIIYNGHLQSLSAASVVFISNYIISQHIASFPLLLTTYLIFQIIFIFDRYKDIEKDEVTNSNRSKHLKKYKKRIPSLLLILLFVLVFTHLLFSNYFSLLVSIWIIIMGVLYNLFLKKLTRYIPIFKNLYVSSFYSAIAFFPFIFHQWQFAISGRMQILSTAFFLQMLFDQFFLDTKDTVVDKKDKLKTFPALFGVKNTIRFLFIYNFLIFLPLIYIAHSANFVYLTMLLIYSFVINLIELYLYFKKPISSYILAAIKLLSWGLVFSAIILIG